jgi:hypothetical protein
VEAVNSSKLAFWIEKTAQKGEKTGQKNDFWRYFLCVWVVPFNKLFVGSSPQGPQEQEVLRVAVRSGHEKPATPKGRRHPEEFQNTSK